MNKIMKRMLILSLLLIVSFSLLINKQHVNAQWGGSSTVNAKTYKQPETEMRAIWVATVSNLNIERQVGTDKASIEKWKQNYLKILDNAEANNMNTIIFQVRPANDAFYPSKYNPWSEYLAGYGVDPGWNPLAWMIDVTHERGLDYHAWLNPYRVTTHTVTSIIENDKIKDVDMDTLNSNKINYFTTLGEKAGNVDNPIIGTSANLLHDVVIGSEGLCILNPASRIVRTHIENTINELVENYEIDGIHFDDYFYPNDVSYGGKNPNYKGYTYSLEPWIDMSDYQQYTLECAQNQVEALSIYDWRRENVNMLIKQVGENIRNINKGKTRKCAFGISPAARYAPKVEACSSEPHRGTEDGMSGSCYNYYSYSDLYADTYKWAKEEWIDYITPQNYSNLNKDYDEIAKWWSNALEGSKTKLYMGTPLYLVTDSWGNGVLEMYYQVLYNDTYVKNVDGYFMFSYSSMLEKIGASSLNVLVSSLWKNDALTPTYPHYQYDQKVTQKATIKKINLKGDLVTIEVNDVDYAKGYGIYGVSKDEPNFDVNNIENFPSASLVSLEINPNKSLSFTRQDGYNYYLVTFDQDNSIFSEVEVINLKNNAPIIDVSIDKVDYLYNEKAKIKVTINDTDSDSYLLNISYAANGTYYGYNICQNEEIHSKEIEKEFVIPETSTTNGKIKVEVIDSYNEVVVEKDIKVKSKAPIITINQIHDIYINNNIECTFSTSDDGFGRVTYKIMLSIDNQEFQLVSEGNARNETISYSQYFTEPASNCQFKIIVSDTENEVVVLSDVFSVLEEKQEEPTHVPQPEPEQPKPSGCKCKNNTNLFLLLSSTLSLAIIVLRKRKH